MQDRFDAPVPSKPQQSHRLFDENGDPVMETNVLQIPEHEEFTIHSDPEKVRENDMKHVNLAFQALRQSWNYVSTPRAAIALCKDTMAAIKVRREVLNIPYGAQAKASPNNGPLTPID